MNCNEVKSRVSIVSYLEGMGLYPCKSTATSLWYISPVTGEAHPSFEVSHDGRMYHDWSSGTSGTIIDLYLAMHTGVSISDALAELGGKSQNYSSCQGPLLPHDRQAGISIKEVRSDICRKLQGYAYGRGITRDVLARYCVEVLYTNARGCWYGLGFRNDKGGYELRSHAFKGCSSPKAITTIGVPRACPYLVFEGFFDFLTAAQLGWFAPDRHVAVVLNSTALVKEAIAALDRATDIYCFLDADAAGKVAYQNIACAYPQAVDYSFSFSPASDLNDALQMNYSKISGHQKLIDY